MRGKQKLPNVQKYLMTTYWQKEKLKKKYVVHISKTIKQYKRKYKRVMDDNNDSPKRWGYSISIEK